MNTFPIVMLLAVMSLAAPVFCSTPGEPDRSLSITNRFAYPGDDVSIVMTISDDLSGANGFDVIMLDVTYDPQLGQVYGIEDTTLYSPIFPGGLVAELDQPGRIRIGVASTRMNANGGQLLFLPFHISENALPGSYPLNLHIEKVTNSQFQPVEINLHDGVFTVFAPPQLGDVNADGSVNILDVSYLLRIYLGIIAPTPAEAHAGDAMPRSSLNANEVGDGYIGADDLNWLLRRVIGVEAAS